MDAGESIDGARCTAVAPFSPEWGALLKFWRGGLCEELGRSGDHWRGATSAVRGFPPMTQYRDISTWVLLVAFAAGGVLGPVTHRIQHGAERLGTTDEPGHPHAVHRADAALWIGEPTDVDLPECDLCARRILVVLHTLVPPSTPQVERPTRVQGHVHVAPIYVFNDRSIRGPPYRPGVRLA